MRRGEGCTENDCARIFAPSVEVHLRSGPDAPGSARPIELLISEGEARWSGLSGAFQASGYLSETLQAPGDSDQRNGLCKGRQLSWES